MEKRKAQTKVKILSPRIHVVTKTVNSRNVFLDQKPKNFLKNLNVFKRTEILVSLVLISLAFFTGAYMVWSSGRSSAENNKQTQNTNGKPDNFVGPYLEAEGLTVAEFTNTSMSLLSDYLVGPSTEDVVRDRKVKLEAYLAFKKSPFAKDKKAIDTLARMPHMKIILEIAFAESTLGKKCIDHNCSNIGSAPDRPYWQKYPSLSNWILDFNRLLEKKYKDYSLKEMCGVYVQPCNENWLAATSQVREELQVWGIE